MRSPILPFLPTSGLLQDRCLCAMNVKSTSTQYVALTQFAQMHNWYTRGYQKVRRLMRWNQYLSSFAHKFCRGYKTTYKCFISCKNWTRHVDDSSFYHRKHFIWYGHPAQSPFSSVTFHNVIVIQCYFLYFNTLLARYTEVKY